MAAPDIRLLPPDTPEALDAARALFREYATGLGVDLCFQNFDAELAALPGDYAAPQGALLLAWVDGELAGCGAFRPLADVDYANACEMKRLYVRRAFRRFGLGRLLAQDLVVTAGEESLTLHFELRKGAFATTVLREVMKVDGAALSIAAIDDADGDE